MPGPRRADAERNLYSDRQFRGGVAPNHHEMHLVRIDDRVPPDQGKNLLAQDRQEVRMTDQAAVVLKQALQPCARDRRLTDRCLRDEAAHAALPPSHFVNRLLSLAGTVISIQSPLIRRAAST